MAHLDFVIFYTSPGLNAAESRTPIDLDSRATPSKYMTWAHNHLYKVWNNGNPTPANFVLDNNRGAHFITTNIWTLIPNQWTLLNL